jgi:hypothetical protein
VSKKEVDHGSLTASADQAIRMYAALILEFVDCSWRSYQREGFQSRSCQNGTKILRWVGVQGHDVAIVCNRSSRCIELVHSRLLGADIWVIHVSKNRITRDPSVQ